MNAVFSPKRFAFFGLCFLFFATSFLADFESGAVDNRGRARETESSDEDGARSTQVVRTGRQYAILIGVDEYPNLAAERQLRFCGRDMELLAETLIANGFPQENVFLAAL